jgi:ATP-binding cassette, subfamily F, member 3
VKNDSPLHSPLMKVNAKGQGGSGNATSSPRGLKESRINRTLYDMKILIQSANISKQYGSKVLFDAATASFAEGQKIGMIGRNGVGKSTLCRMILGDEEPDGGDIVISPDLRLGYLAQHDLFKPEETVEQFLMRHTGKAEWECGKIAGQFQLKNDLLTRMPISELSGGFRTRVKLAAMLLQDPNFLILDEPTNFLDLSTVILLEHFLRDFAGGYLLVSHDREFLKKTCDHTLELENGEMLMFPGDVETYLAYKEEIQIQKARINKNIHSKRKELQAFVDRFRAKATKAKQAQSRAKQLDKLEPITIDHPIKTARIRIPQVTVRKGLAMKCDNLSIGYPGNTVAESIHLTIDRGARVAVLGDNGQGKTTFLRTLIGDLPELDGEIEWGYKMHTSYYAQHVYKELPADMDIFTYLQGQASPELMRQDILDMAGSFLFSGAIVDQKIGVLSGGERARLCLAGLLLARRPVLLLDEPTNHLDFETVEALGRALREYQGTILFVCHDRTFVQLVASQILDIGDGAVRHYSGSYEEYVYRLEQMASNKPVDAPAEDDGPKEQSNGKTAWLKRKELRSQMSKVKTRLRKTEKLIQEFEREKNEIILDFDVNPTSWSMDRNERLGEVSGLLEAEEIVWVELQEELEQLKQAAPD